MGGKSSSGLPPSGFGPELRRVRDEKKLTQKELAEKAGIYPNTVAKLERGEMEPSWQVVVALAQALGVECTEFKTANSDSPDLNAEKQTEKPTPKKKAKK